MPMVAHDEERRHRAFLAAAQLRHAWQFRRRGQHADEDPVEVNVPAGWHDLLEQLFAEVEAAVPAEEQGGFRWRRLAAIQGGLEIRFDGVRDRILPAVTRARDTAAVCCEGCGRPGRRRQVAGMHRVSCDVHFVERLRQHDGATEQGAGNWWLSPHPGLGGRTPAAVLRAGPPPEVLIDLALRRAMPPTPRLNGAHRQRLQLAWPVLREAFGERLRSLRLAEFEPGAGRGGTLLALLAGEVDAAAQAGVASQLARAGFSDLRLRLVGQDDLRAPATADDPWSTMLALEASVSIPRHQPAVPR
mgnify:CR=1 FL=1